MAVTEISGTDFDIEQIGAHSRDPLWYTRYAYPWGTGELKNSPGPRKFQQQVLATLRDHLQNPETRFKPCRVAIASGHDIGKTALMAFVSQWGLSSCADARINVTAGTGQQLKTRTMPEMAKWARMMINRDWFEFRTESVISRQPTHEQTWRMDFITWSEDNPQAVAGLHNEGKRIVIIFDEASTIADKVWDAVEGTMSGHAEKIWLAFGQPERVDGRFAECFGRFKNLWYHHQIDSRTVEGADLDWCQSVVDRWGEDHDITRVRVRGELPRSSLNQFIDSETVGRCRREYKARGYESLPKILAVDVARFGDDQSVIGWRQGRKAKICAKLRGLDTVQVAERAIEIKQREQCDAMVIDGDGLGAGTVDQVRFRGFQRFEFHGAAAPNDPAMYANKRTECWGLCRDWLQAGAEIGDDPELEADLTGPQYAINSKQQIQLERKEDMKKRGLASPDCGDMLAMTFAVKMQAKPRETPRPQYQGGSREQSWMA
jgi:hypothetical protein